MKTRTFLIAAAGSLAAVGLGLWTLKDRAASRAAPRGNETAPLPQAKAVTTAKSSAPREELPQTKSAAIDLTTVPVSVRAIIDLAHNYNERLQTARSLRPSLSPEELKVLYEFLRERNPEDDNQRGHALKSDVMDALVAQNPLPGELLGLFAEVYRDQDQHVVLRDYAVQHLAMLYERLDETAGWPANQVSSQRTQISALLWEAVGETDSSIGATALLSLNRLSETHPGFDRARLASVALQLAGDATMTDGVRISALQVSARMKVNEALPLSLEIAQSPSTTALRISAIGAIGLLGGSAELKALERLVANGNDQLRPAATVAAQRIRQRTVGSNAFNGRKP